MKNYVLAILIAGGVGCAVPQPEASQTFAVGKDIAYPALIAKDQKGRKYAICQVAQGIVERQLKAAGATFPPCSTEPQVEDAGEGRYSIKSWVEVGQRRTGYSGEAVIEDEGGVPRTLRIVRLDLEGK